jgi:hypothetical protein
MTGSMPFMQGVPLHIMQLSSVTPMLVHWSAGFMKEKQVPKSAKRAESTMMERMAWFPAQALYAVPKALNIVLVSIYLWLRLRPIPLATAQATHTLRHWPHLHSAG